MILLFVSLAVLLLAGIPVFVAIGGAAAIYILVNGINPIIVIQQMVAGVDSFTLLAVPFFILAANFMNRANVTDRLYNFAHAMVSHWRGGLGHVTIYGSLLFSMMSGTAVADAAGLGAIQLKAMRARNYPDRFSVGITAISSLLGPIMPPSLALVVYGFVANVSVGQLFMAGVVPALLCAISLHLAVIFFARRMNMPTEERRGWKERLRTFWFAIPALMTPVIIIGGILAGVATPTEAAGVASLYALLLGTVVYRTLNLRSVLDTLRETFETTSTLLIMVAGSIIFGWVLVRENAARDFAMMMLSFVQEPWQVMAILIAILLVAGMFLDTIAVILIAMPIFMPVLAQYQIDPVQFGIVMVLSLMIGMVTPPIGIITFVISRIAGMGYMATFRACAPFLVPIFIVMVLVAVFPQIATTLPRLLSGG
jgi:tripartite ATP-independent transporter DctM subunit